MTQARLLEVLRTETPEGVLLNYRFEFAGRAQEVWFRVSEAVPTASAETFLAFTLLPAMRVGASPVVDLPVSEQLLRTIPTIQDIFACWLPETFHRVSVQATAGTPPPRVADEVGCFFSGGVDSFYTLLKHNDEITTLFLILGFERRMQDPQFAAAVFATVGDIARRFRKRLVTIETNVREFSNVHASFDLFHGSLLASVALLLAPSFSKVFIPATHTYRDLMPWGSHPLLDSHWSTERLQIVHDGCEATRVEKVAALAQSEEAMNTLRVCFARPEEYNCGKCDKCLRTMVNLHLAGALGRCKTLPAELDLNNVARIRIEGESARAFAHENIRALRARNGDPRVIKAIEDALAGRYHRGLRRVPQKIRRWVGRRFSARA